MNFLTFDRIKSRCTKHINEEERERTNLDLRLEKFVGFIFEIQSGVAMCTQLSLRCPRRRDRLIRSIAKNAGRSDPFDTRRWRRRTGSLVVLITRSLDNKHTRAPRGPMQDRLTSLPINFRHDCSCSSTFLSKFMTIAGRFGY